jgi:hypothetical protein
MIKVSSSNATKTLMLVGMVIAHAMPALAQDDAGKQHSWRVARLATERKQKGTDF